MKIIGITDIDKAYALMAALDKNGMYQEMQNGELSFINDPLVNINSISPNENIIHDKLNQLMNLQNDGPEYNRILTEVVNFISEVLKTEDVIINENIVYTFLNGDDLSNSVKKFKKIESDLRFELLSKTGIEQNKDSVKGMQNYILETIINLYGDPRTLVATNNPTTMQPVHDAVEYVGKGKELRSHWDAFTDFYVNQTTSVGKKDIGISAVAQKAFYALNYYNFIRQTQGKSVFDFFNIKDVPEEWGGAITSYGFPDTRIDRNSLNLLINDILNNSSIWNYIGEESNMSKYSHENGFIIWLETKQEGVNKTYDVYVGKDFSSKKKLVVGDRIGDFMVTTLNSAIISSSTDNAKEMMMDLLNATPEILQAYEFLFSIGVDIRQAAAILTDPMINAIITVTRGNLFNNKKGYSRAKDVLSKKGKKDVKEVLELRGIEFDQTKWQILEKIFAGAQELTILGQSLGINGGIKVEFGEPLLFQLNFERNTKDVIGQTFHLDRFLSDYIPFNDSAILLEGSYSKKMIDLYEEHKTRYNLLDLIFNVPHFYSMFTVPLQFKNAMQLLSKDIDNVYRIAESQSFKVWWNQDGLRQLHRAVIDRKTTDFFVKYPFKYKSTFVVDDKKIVRMNEEILSTNTKEGLVTLKTFIETNIIPMLKTEEKFSDNEFVKNLVPSSTIHPLFKKPFNFYGSRISLTDPQNEDLVHIIKKGFDLIKDEIINEHSVLEWMFVYDLLINKHSLGSNSMPVLFTNGVDLTSKNIITSYIEYINEYDSSSGHYKPVSKPFNFLPIHVQKMVEDPDGNKPSGAIWQYDPNILPLFIDNGKIIEDILVERASLFEAFKRGFLRANKC